MRQMKSKYILFSLIFLTMTEQVFASGAKLPDIKSEDVSVPVIGQTGAQETSPPPIPMPTPTTTPIPIPIPKEASGAYAETINGMVADSGCFKYSWGNRGRAPAGYVKGVTLSFARSLCRLKSQSSLSAILSAAGTQDDSKDALTHYQSVFKNLSIPVTVAGEAPLRALYTLGMGLGMRESSGKYCEGWDRSAGSSRPSSAGEAGIFQTSYDSISASSELAKLYEEYKASPERCLLDVFKEGASCSSLSNLGTGAGASYQAFNKSCPAFATEYAMTMLRIRRSHYGPINRKEAEVVPVCQQLLKSVQDFVNSDPYACEDLR